MSRPKLISNQNYLLVEIRVGNYGDLYENMEVIYRDSCYAGQEWPGEEGERLCARYTSYPNVEPPAVNFCAAGFLGVNEGQFETTRF